MSKVIIVSNRLPLRVEGNESSGLKYIPSEGGLATGLGSVYKGGDNVWIGWPGIYLENEKMEEEARQHLKEENMQPVFLRPVQIEKFYEGFCNSTLWPNFHYFTQHAIYKRSLWESYVEVNQLFCEEVLRVAKPGDTIWVHDYQLFLLPGLIRNKMPDIAIGFFLHIPFPSHEVFRLIPWRKQLLEGVLGSDLIGFHTYDDMRHFLSAVNRLVYLPNQQGTITKDNRTIVVDAFPMGIDYDKYASQAAAPETLSREVQFRTSLGTQKLILSIDRLDYSKGIPARLVNFELFLTIYPQFHNQVSLILLVVPSRDKVAEYKELKEQVDLLVGRINGRFGSMNWTPIHYFYRSLPFEDLSALYRMSEVALVTPMRDGMNLVCKEYIASKLDKKGVLILSEMAGASKELNDAILINPNDKHQVVEALKTALEMPVKEQVHHIDIMQKTLKKYNVHHWVNLFLGRLKVVKEQQEELSTRLIDKKMGRSISEKFSNSNKRLLFLDYDGTLMDFKSNPDAVTPDSELIDLLKNLSAQPETEIVIISGRDKNTLENWLGDLPLNFVAEHGVWLKYLGKEWETVDELDIKWKKDIRDILETYVAKTPGSLIEEKDYSLVWHYRKVETGLGELRAREIVSHLKFLAQDNGLMVLEGNKVVEIKNQEINKGRTAAKWLNTPQPDFIVAIGDDWTDEDTFKAMPEHAITIKVGAESSVAKYSLRDPEHVRKFLGGIIGKRE